MLKIACIIACAVMALGTVIPSAYLAISIVAEKMNKRDTRKEKAIVVLICCAACSIGLLLACSAWLLTAV
jgi:hypothetical protein